MELRNEPMQARSSKRLQTIEAAAEEAIATVGIDRFTTADVARIAGCSIGTVYRYFPDRVAILDRLRPHRYAAAAELEEQRRIIRNLIAVATTLEEHEYAGCCPDPAHPGARDAGECKACFLLVEAERAVGG